MGIVNTDKTMSQSAGPLITGNLAQDKRFWVAFVVAGSLKAGYDIGMLTCFGRVKLEGGSGSMNKVVDEEDDTERRAAEFSLEDSDEDSEMEMDSLRPMGRGNVAELVKADSHAGSRPR